MRRTPSASPTTSRTGCRDRCGPGTWAGPSGSPRASAPACCRSTRTTASTPRRRSEGSSGAAWGGSSGCTPWSSTPRSRTCSSRRSDRPDGHTIAVQMEVTDPAAGVGAAPTPAGGRQELPRSPFPPIAGYGFLSDREVGALVAPSGNVEWLCLPRPDGPSVLGAALDRSAGGFRVGPADVMVPAGRRYLPGTMVLETTWQTRTGWMIVRDALTIGPWYSTKRLEHYRRPPGDHEAEHCLLRTIKCVNGHVELALNCEPVFDYGRVEARWDYSDLGYGQAVARGKDGDPVLRLTTSLRLAFEGRSAHAYSTLAEGDSAFAALTWTDEPSPPLSFDEAADRMWRTGDYWRGGGGKRGGAPPPRRRGPPRG